MRSSADAVRTLCSDLRRGLDEHGLIVEKGLRARVLEAHSEHGMTEAAELRIVLAPPAPPERLARLQALCRERFRRGLPADYVAFLEANDGLCVADLSLEGAVRMARDPSAFGDHALLSSALLCEALEPTVGGFAQEGVEAPALLPFYSLLESGSHAFDFSGPEAEPVVVDVDGERAWSGEGRELLAPSFSAWFAAFLRAGLEPFATRASLLGG